jgi:5-methylcytosine-specific restriction protein A
MPYAAKRYCNRTGCHQFAIPGSSYCAEHQQSTAHDYDAARRNEAEHLLYKTAQWSAVRRHYLDAHPLCEECEKAGRVTAATMVHHRVPIRDDPGLAFNESNLESLCASCHNELHPSKGGQHDD